VAITRGELKTNIYLQLGKTATNPGFFTSAKVEKAIEEAMDFVAEEMMDADEGWAVELVYASPAAGAASLDLGALDADIAMIREVRYKVGDVYVRMEYDSAAGADQVSSDSDARQGPGTYRTVGNSLVFNPALAEGGTNQIQIEAQMWPTYAAGDGSDLPASFQRATWHFMKYKACSILASSIEKMSRPWAQEEAQWFDKMQRVLVKRNQQTTRIKEFEG
jgi:hypothetical protein